MSPRAAPASILLLVACATGEPSATSYASVGITNITGVGSSSGAVEATSEGSDSSGDGTTGEPTTSSGEFPTTSGPTSDTTTDPTAVDPTTSTVGDTTTGDACGGPCEAPPGPCHQPVGQCIVGECVYSQLAAGEACDDGDGCTQDDSCDGAGLCAGAPISCEAANATGGACKDGACEGFVCTKPYEDCDGDMANGCEVPIGVANQCDQNGLNPDGGCWTAYCGQLDDPGATNFATYYCYDCANCNTPSPGMWRWCAHDTGNWYDAAVGNCPAKDLDKVCVPP